MVSLEATAELATEQSFLLLLLVMLRVQLLRIQLMLRLQLCLRIPISYKLRLLRLHLLRVVLLRLQLLLLLCEQLRLLRQTREQLLISMPFRFLLVHKPVAGSLDVRGDGCWGSCGDSNTIKCWALHMASCRDGPLSESSI